MSAYHVSTRVPELSQTFVIHSLTTLQYYYQTGQKQRVNFIARRLSFHGNTIGTLSLCHHPARRGPYEVNLSHDTFHHVSPAYAKRFQKPDETEEQYVERLKQELEDKFRELGPDTVIGCASFPLSLLVIL